MVGQDHLVGPGAPLRRAYEQGRLYSLLLCGPPGAGKTTIARLLGQLPGYAFEQHSAGAIGLAELRAVFARARGRGKPTALFVDEIHRLNHAQQDGLLGAVEEGLVTLIGATAENPYFTLSRALLSRLRLFTLKALSEEDLVLLLERALAREGAEGSPPAVERRALAALARAAGGDGRVALGSLEAALAQAPADGPLDLATVSAVLAKPLAYDRAGDAHYDYISAWIKATRGSDPDASIYYLAAMLEGGEDPRFIARRMVILASEDIGNADPQALLVAVGAAQAVEQVGLPEASYALAQAAIYLSLAPKSNAAGKALATAQARIAAEGVQPPPPYLRSGPRPGAEQGEPYIYPHDTPRGLSGQTLMPPRLQGHRFYQPAGSEAMLARRLAAREAQRREGGGQ